MTRRRPADDEDVFPDYTIEYGERANDIIGLMAAGGMSLRDYFAGQALAGLLASGRSVDLGANAYNIADKMLEVRRGGGA